jgi:hypothetical protein
MITAQYTNVDNSMILATIDGVSMSVPAVVGNRYYDLLIKDDVTIDPYVAPTQTYKELRAAEYNLKTTGEQFGMQYDDAKNSTTTWVDWQTEIKARITK